MQDIGYHNLQPHALQPKADHQAGPAHSRGNGGLGKSAGRCFFKHLCFPPAPAAAATSFSPLPASNGFGLHPTAYASRALATAFALGQHWLQVWQHQAYLGKCPALGLRQQKTW